MTAALTLWRVLIREADKASRGELGGIVGPLRVALAEVRGVEPPCGEVGVLRQEAEAYAREARLAVRISWREVLRTRAAEADQALAAIGAASPEPTPPRHFTPPPPLHPDMFRARLPYKDE